MPLVERPNPYGRPVGSPVIPDSVPRHRADGGCLEAVWIRATHHLPCEGKGEHDIHWAQFGRHIVRWWGEIGETKIEPAQFTFP